MARRVAIVSIIGTVVTAIAGAPVHDRLSALLCVAVGAVSIMAIIATVVCEMRSASNNWDEV